MMDISETVSAVGSFGLLQKVHDHIWKDKKWALVVRNTACNDVCRLACGPLLFLLRARRGQQRAMKTFRKITNASPEERK